MSEYHQHTRDWFNQVFNLSYVPSWYSEYWRVTTEVCNIITLMQSHHYENLPTVEVKDYLRYVCHRYIIRSRDIWMLVGIGMTDRSDPFTAIQDFLAMGNPKLKHSRHHYVHKERTATSPTI